jgi:hypothetical protein
MNDLMMNSIAHSRIDDLHRQATARRRVRNSGPRTSPVRVFLRSVLAQRQPQPASRAATASRASSAASVPVAET